ncbi:exported protein [Mammaliicoccus stepanovicii]|uniref:Exported protein n=2 Tax=Mammaliicoccus stepanovicii TaxID=643214 RepID=A0A239YQT5_9STAP|nr:exported protein [Mammaliicoccus stepanovicii]
MMKKLFLIGLSIFLIFGIAGTFLWFTVNNKYEKQESFEKVFQNNQIDQIIVNGQNTDVEVKQGNTLKLKYEGNHDVNANVENKLLHFSEHNKKFTFNANFIPFRKTKNTLTITLPKKQYEAFNITTNTGNIVLSDVNSDNSNMITETGKITYHNVDMKHAKAMSDLGNIHVNQSNLTEFNGELDTGNIFVENSRLVNSELLTNIGNIDVDDLKNECNIKSSIEDGNLTISYAKKPKDTLLQLHAESGKKRILNKEFSDEKVGPGNHVIEGYTDKGDITIE